MKLYRFGDNGFINKQQIEKNIDLANEYKILVPKASPGGDSYPHSILSKPIISAPQSCCTETYIVIGSFQSEEISKRVATYISTRFFRFLILLTKSTQDVAKKVYTFVPMQNFNESWTDEKLYKKYGLNEEEIKFIESMIRPMELSNE